MIRMTFNLFMGVRGTYILMFTIIIVSYDGMILILCYCKCDFTGVLQSVNQNDVNILRF